MIAALDAWFDRIAGAVHAFGGEVLKFIGDGVLAIFPVTGTPADACEAALRAVAAARAGMTHLDEARHAQGLPPLPFGVALHLGEILWGNIGAADRLDFTAIGPAVNLVSRLEGLCRPLDRSVLISGAVAAETVTPLMPLGEHAMRGIAAPCAVFTLPDVRAALRRKRDHLYAKMNHACMARPLKAIARGNGRCRALPCNRQVRKASYILQFTPKRTFCASLSRLWFTPVLVVPEVVPKFM